MSSDRIQSIEYKCSNEIGSKSNGKEDIQMDENRNVSVPRVMNAGQVAEYLGISKQGAYNLMNSATFPTLRVGKRLLVSTDKFLEWIEEHSDNNQVAV